MKLFLGFVYISGIGWAVDMLAYTALTQGLGWQPAFSNFCSSMLAVTYVWIVSLEKLFDRGNYKGSALLPIYWIYQASSNFGYSVIIGAVTIQNFNRAVSELSMLPPEVTAKILITPINLLTNFIFMKTLTQFMKNGNGGQ